MLILFVFVSLLSFINSQKLSPLQISGFPISLTFAKSNSYGFADGAYQLSLRISQKSDSIPSIIYCWIQTYTQPQQGDQMCDVLFDQQSQFRCIQVNYTRIPADAQKNISQTLQASWTQLTFSKQKGVNVVGNSSTLINISKTTPDVARKIGLDSSYFQTQTIYYMLASQSRSALFTFQDQNTPVKLAYIHTWLSTDLSDTIISQRYYYCMYYDDKIIYIFQGSVVRQNLPYYFTSILTTTNQDGKGFHMWGGYSYSLGHASRDMFGYQSLSDNFYDMYSLYASAPYDDLASNIGGKKNIIRISTSKASSIGSADFGQDGVFYKGPFFHFIQVYRPWNTADTAGDDVIRQKIENRFCFAAYFEPFNSSVTSNLSIFSNSYKHQLVDCHSADVTLFNGNIQLNIIILIILLIGFLY